MRELDRAEIEAVLLRNGFGVLALLDGEQPYAIPMSYGYGDEEPIFAMQFGRGERSRKKRGLESNARASFTVYEELDDGRWHSVVLTGELYEVPESDVGRALEVLADNATFAPDLGVWGRSLQETSFDLVGLDIEEWGGREFSAGE